MKRVKLYLDTSIPSFLFADDAREKQEETIRFWDLLTTGIFTIVVSDLLLIELGRCGQDLHQKIAAELRKITFEIIEQNTEVLELSQKYVLGGIIPSKYTDDAVHLALATVSNCDAVVSWNFKHLVKLKTIRGVNGINKINGYPEIEILTPSSWVQDEITGGI